MNRVVKWLEPFSADGIGWLLNLCVSAVAYAGVINPQTLNPQWIAVAGAAGGLVSALVHIGVVSLGAEPVSRREVLRAAIEGMFAVLEGGLVAAYLGPQANRFFYDATPSDLRAVGFDIGMGASRFAPGVFGAIKLLSNPATLRELALRWLTSMRPTP